jgi:hypothetical protein
LSFQHVPLLFDLVLWVATQGLELAGTPHEYAVAILAARLIISARRKTLKHYNLKKE